MINFDDYTNENKTNLLLNLIENQPDIDKIFQIKENFNKLQ